MLRFEIQRSKTISNLLQILCNQLHYFENIFERYMTMVIDYMPMVTDYYFVN